MRIVSGGINGVYLEEIRFQAQGKSQWVKAAIAYANGHPKLIDDAMTSSNPFTIFFRYDQSVPVSTNILERFLNDKSLNRTCRLVPDIFHPKIIWWGGYGVYIGSANLTDRAWFDNIEIGMFLSHEEIVENDLEAELNLFFDEVHKKSHALTKEVYDELCELEKAEYQQKKAQERQRDLFEKRRKIPRLAPLQRITRKNAREKQKQIFLKEWHDTLQILRNIADRVSDDNNRPEWISSDTPKGVQADQFLHAFYYNFVKEGNKALHHEFYEINSRDPESAFVEKLNWWKHTSAPPSEEDKHIDMSRIVKAKLAKDTINSLSEQDFIEVCRNVHALLDHSLRVRNSTLGLPANYHTDQIERIKLLGAYIYNQKSTTGMNVLNVLSHVLYGGSVGNVPERMWDAIDQAEYSISHFGVSSLGEIIGWTMPDIYPPRNGRTSKALRAFGYNVRIHSE